MHIEKINYNGNPRSVYFGKSEILMIAGNSRTSAEFFTYDESNEFLEISKDDFALAVVGENYKEIEEQLPYSIEDYKIAQDEKSNVYFCYYQEGIIHGFDKDAKRFLKWNAGEIGKGHSIYDIDYQFPDFLWLAFPTGQTVTQVSISEQKEVYKIGRYSWEDNYELLCYPESVFVNEKFVFIPNMGHNKLFRFDTETRVLKLIYTFEDRLWEYGENDLGRFIVTDTGIYELKN